MTTETGNAPSQAADPAQSYGLAKWLAGQQFSQQRTPTATYQAPMRGRINLQSALDPYPWLNNLPVRDGGGDDRGSGYGGSSGTGLTESGYNNEIADPFAGVSNNARIGGLLGSAFGPAVGAIGRGAGMATDVQSVQDRMKNLGFDYDFTKQDYFELAPRTVTGILGKTPQDIGRTRYQELLADYMRDRPELGLIDRQDIEMGQWGGGYARDHFGWEDVNNDFGWTWGQPDGMANAVSNTSTFIDSLGRPYSGPDGSGLGATGGPTGGWLDKEGGYGESEGGGWGGGGGYGDDGNESDQN